MTKKNKRTLRITGIAGIVTGLGMVFLFDNSNGLWITVLGGILLIWSKD